VIGHLAVDFLKFVHEARKHSSRCSAQLSDENLVLVVFEYLLTYLHFVTIGFMTVLLPSLEKFL
jgi:hypothetical protein